MDGQFVGPMPVADFLKAFLPEATTPCPPIGGRFHKLRSAPKKKFEDQFISAVNASGICPGLDLFNTTTKAGKQYAYDQKPDISVCIKTRSVDADPTTSPGDSSDSEAGSTISEEESSATTSVGSGESSSESSDDAISSGSEYVPEGRPSAHKPSHAVDWFAMELCIECKPHEHDPFSDPSPKNTADRDTYNFERISKRGTEARGQLISYASAHMSMQFRAFCFSVCLLNQKDARLIRWDRSGALVTERFDFTKEGSPLAEFLWRFSHMDYAQRGHDMTVTRASKGEISLARSHGLEGDIHKVLVVNDADKAEHHILIAAPTEYKLVVTGRASFGNIGVDMETKAKVWLKDSWRINVDEIEKEYAVYSKLEKVHVRNIAPLVCGGDVGNQETVTQKYADAAWRYGKVDLLPHRHYRLVLGIIGRPLKNFNSTREMVRAVYHALIAHWDAFFLAKVLHRDISGGNILIVEDGEETRGVLIDWDLSKEESVETAQPRRKWRTGTWRFISAAILMNTSKVHEYWHDLESFAHVITYHILRYRPWNLQSFRSYMDHVYDSTDPQEDSDEVLGGKGKQAFFGDIYFEARTLKKVMPPHLAGVINELRASFKFSYKSGEEYDDDREKAHLKLQSPDLYLGILERYLELDDWATDDKSDDQLKAKPSGSQACGTGRKRKANFNDSTFVPRDFKRACRERDRDTSSTLTRITET
ncbi:hypothetical protein DENSPDRAFT_926442 [Dentipellis sp. KUC8613]|nr:hypothetical protein DENSPDRAFT_926442 [Dentipellis sp. KUC8613]